MAIEKEYKPENLQLKNWEKLAKDCDLQPQYLFKIIKEMAGSLPKVLIKTHEEFAKTFGLFPALQRVDLVIKKQCQ